MKKQVIQQLQNTLEGVMQEWINTKQELAEVRIELEETIKLHTIEENQFNDSYEDLMGLYVKQRTELEETQEALRRNRKQLESYKEFERMYKSSKITNTTLYKSNISYAIENCNYKNMSVWQFIIKKFK